MPSFTLIQGMPSPLPTPTAHYVRAAVLNNPKKTCFRPPWRGGTANEVKVAEEKNDCMRAGACTEAPGGTRRSTSLEFLPPRDWKMQCQVGPAAFCGTLSLDHGFIYLSSFLEKKTVLSKWENSSGSCLKMVVNDPLIPWSLLERHKKMLDLGSPPKNEQKQNQIQRAVSVCCYKWERVASLQLFLSSLLVFTSSFFSILSPATSPSSVKLNSRKAQVSAFLEKDFSWKKLQKVYSLCI